MDDLQQEFIHGWNSGVDRFSKPADFEKQSWSKTSSFRDGVEASWNFIKHNKLNIFDLQDEKLYL